MALRGWSWEAALGPVGLGDRPLLEALEAALPDEAVEATGEATGTRERRRRRLPTPLVVTRVVALGLWAAESGRHILAEVVAGWREGPASDAAGWELPGTAAIVQARQRVGARLLRERFGAVARPIATARTGGACLGGLRLMAIAGTTLDVADTRGNDRAFRRPTTGRGTGASPQIRVLALIETGTHVIGDAVIRPFRSGAVPTARHLLRSVGAGLLLRGLAASTRLSWSAPRSRSGPTAWGGPGRTACSARPRSCRMARAWPGAIPPPRHAAATSRGSSSGWSQTPATRRRDPGGAC